MLGSLDHARVPDFIWLHFAIIGECIDRNKRTPHICLRCNHCYWCHFKIARHIRIPTIKATINPTIPMIISKPEPVVYFPMFFNNIRFIFKDHFQIVWSINESSFADPVVILRRIERIFAAIALSLSINTACYDAVIFIILR
jgi:hypothetical protein